VLGIYNMRWCKRKNNNMKNTISNGLQKEITFARQNGIPVIYIDENLTIREA
jgi:hypothetical protein